MSSVCSNQTTWVWSDIKDNRVDKIGQSPSMRRVRSRRGIVHAGAANPHTGVQYDG